MPKKYNNNGLYNPKYLNTNLSNLSATGEAHFANPSLSNLNTTGNAKFDGPWTKKHSNLLSSTALGTYTIDLSSYLPNDGKTYEILIKHSGYSTSTSEARMHIATGIISKTQVLAPRSGAVHNVNTFIVPVGPNRLLQYILEGVAAGAMLIEALAYKRTK